MHFNFLTPLIWSRLSRLSDCLTFLKHPHKVVRSSCKGGEKIAAEDVYYILMHFSGQLDYAKVFFLFTLFNSDKESDSDTIRDRSSTISKKANIMRISDQSFHENSWLY